MVSLPTVRQNRASSENFWARWQKRSGGTFTPPTPLTLPKIKRDENSPLGYLKTIKKRIVFGGEGQHEKKEIDTTKLVRMFSLLIPLIVFSLAYVLCRPDRDPCNLIPRFQPRHGGCGSGTLVVDCATLTVGVNILSRILRMLYDLERSPALFRLE
ncbi:hypothetical protein V1478_010996 [Vespula squamosa]|uniref:Uncharacterized protein n=1 Tax=Vespula squamosa TaxID=30214 RepID=A0ABD2AG16_VESSQ